MSEDLTNEIEAINAIYGDETIRGDSNDGQGGVYILTVPHLEVTLRLSVPSEYPQVPFQILGTGTIGDSSRKGYGSHVLQIARDMLKEVFVSGSVCLFDLLQELDDTLSTEKASTEDAQTLLPFNESTSKGQVEAETPTVPTAHGLPSDIPQWTLSTPISEKKSVFLARACPVTSPRQARAYVEHLLATDRRAAKATHNITAYRIRSPNSCSSSADITYQDCDDDGETAAGGRLLHLLQVMDVWGVLVVVSRWYGGVKLGPDRFRVISTVAREAVVQGGWGKKG